MNEVVKNALEEWKRLENTREAHLAFSRKIHTAEAHGFISREELEAIKKGIEELKHENFMRMQREDVRRLELAEMHAVEGFVRKQFGL